MIVDFVELLLSGEIDHFIDDALIKLGFNIDIEYISKHDNFWEKQPCIKNLKLNTKRFKKLLKRELDLFESQGQYSDDQYNGFILSKAEIVFEVVRKTFSDYCGYLKKTDTKHIIKFHDKELSNPEIIELLFENVSLEHNDMIYVDIPDRLHLLTYMCQPEHQQKWKNLLDALSQEMGSDFNYMFTAYYITDNWFGCEAYIAPDFDCEYIQLGGNVYFQNKEDIVRYKLTNAG